MWTGVLRWTQGHYIIGCIKEQFKITYGNGLVILLPE